MINTKTRRGLEIRFPLDPELAVALDDACQADRASRTTFLRNALLRELRKGGFLGKSGRTMGAAR